MTIQSVHDLRKWRGHVYRPADGAFWLFNWRRPGTLGWQKQNSAKHLLSMYSYYTQYDTQQKTWYSLNWSSLVTVLRVHSNFIPCGLHFNYIIHNTNYTLQLTLIDLIKSYYTVYTTSQRSHNLHFSNPSLSS